MAGRAADLPDASPSARVSQQVLCPPTPHIFSAWSVAFRDASEVWTVPADASCIVCFETTSEIAHGDW